MAGDIRQLIDEAALSTWLSVHIPDFVLPLVVKQFGFGQSNPTYLLSSTSRPSERLVLRKQPPGKLLSPTAHAVDREYRVIRALAATAVPVPQTFALCLDRAVLGTPFYVMEFLDGRIFEEAEMPGLGEKERNDLWRAAVTTLASLHRVDHIAIGLDSFGRNGGFYTRQLKTLNGISAAQAATRDIETDQPAGSIPHFEELVRFFGNTSRQPVDRITLIHGDYKIDNLVFHKTEARVIGIIDWEMSTIGHPLSDLSNLLAPYTYAASTTHLPSLISTSSLTPHNPFAPHALAAGLPSHTQCLHWYAAAAGWDLALESPWGAAFGVLRNCVVIQGIRARYARRQASSAKARETGELMQPYGEFCWMLVRALEGERAKL